MSEEIRVGRPPERVEGMGMNMSSRAPQGGRNNMPWIILAVVVLLLVVGAVLFRDKLFTGQSGDTAQQVEEKLSGYQAVFLSNGQVYFGKLSDVTASYSTLVDIYYLQVTQPPLQGSQQEDQVSQQQQPQLSLVKLGQELHGPVDEMKINREHILFYEDLKEDGRVVQAIRDYQANPNAGTQQQQAPAGQQQAPAGQQQAPAGQQQAPAGQQLQQNQ
ncbi:TPA: hypothetical protein DCG61_01885 [Patescibacteria group bacterium]|jgi:flagellar basal body-associated protein FliL|nr:hypothetical protein [Patescibacteria group bacterium]